MGHLFPTGSPVKVQQRCLVHCHIPSTEESARYRAATGIFQMNECRSPKWGRALGFLVLCQRLTSISFIQLQHSCWKLVTRTLPPTSSFSRPQLSPVLHHLFQTAIRPCLKTFAFLSLQGEEINGILREASFLISRKIFPLPFFFSLHPFARPRLLN